MSYLLIHGDSRRLPIDLASVDAVIADPPYGTRIDRDGYGRRQLWDGKRHVTGDDSLETMQRGMSEAFRCLKQNTWAAVFCSPKRHAESIEACKKAGFVHVGEFVWDKMMPGLGGGIRYQHENILLMGKGKPSGLASLPSVLRFTSRVPCEHAIHASKKPEALFRTLVKYCCPVGGIVLDPFVGAGTLILAAIATGRRAIGVELESDCIAIAQRRITRPHARPIRPTREEALPLFPD